MGERRDRRRPAGTANSNSAGRPDAQPRLNVFYIPKDAAWPNFRFLRPQNAIKRIYFNFASRAVIRHMGVCQGLDRRRRSDFRRADDPDGLPVVWASDLREAIIITLDRAAVLASC